MSGEIKVTCPKCHETIIYDIKNNVNITNDMMGEKIRPEALKNLQENRIKCCKCQAIFCKKCNSIPFHEGSTCEEQKLISKNIICRFCHEYPAVSCENLDPCHYICWHQECKENTTNACMHLCKCGHPCCGLVNEQDHFGCPLCNKSLSHCSICQRSCSESPSVIMKCGHPAHKICLEQHYKSLDVKGRIIIPRCNFNFTCQEIPYHDCVKDIAQKWVSLNAKIEEMIKLRMELEDTEHEKKYVCNPNDTSYYNQPLKFAHDYFVFYLCNKCNEPYYAGHKNCRESVKDDSIANKICPRCDINFLNANCSKHGEVGMIIKCMFCCKPALFNCGQYYCEECHKDPSKAQSGPHPTCNGKCQFSPHQPNGKQVVIGYCSICEEEKEKSKLTFS